MKGFLWMKILTRAKGWLMHVDSESSGQTPGGGEKAAVPIGGGE